MKRRRAKTITLSRAVLERLRKLMLPGETFSDVILRIWKADGLSASGELLCDACAQIDAHFDKHPAPKAAPKLRKTMREGRRRRAKR